jgi:hypothetical protein
MICHFDYGPAFRQYEKTNFLQLVSDWCFIVDGKRYWIPSGYYADGASIPRPFWAVIGSPFEPDLFSGFLPHDWIYLTHCLPRPAADEIFRRFLIACGVSAWRARIMWTAVSTAGALAWNNTALDRAEIQQIVLSIADRPDRDKFEFSI